MSSTLPTRLLGNGPGLSSGAAIQRAVQHAADAGVAVTFAMADAAELAGYEGVFDTIIETGLLANGAPACVISGGDT